MNKMYLGIDYGQGWIGVAWGNANGMISPLKAIHNKNKEQAILEIKQYCDEYEISKIVMGISEGELKEEMEEFASNLNLITKTELELVNEDNSSHQARNLARASEIRLRNLKTGEHSYAAGEILRKYLSGKNNF